MWGYCDWCKAIDNITGEIDTFINISISGGECWDKDVIYYSLSSDIILKLRHLTCSENAADDDDKTSLRKNIILCWMWVVGLS